MKSGLKDLFPHVVGVFNIWALSKNPQLSISHVFGDGVIENHQAAEHIALVTSRYQHETRNIQRDGRGPGRTLIGHDMFLGSSNVKFDSCPGIP